MNESMMSSASLQSSHTSQEEGDDTIGTLSMVCDTGKYFYALFLTTYTSPNWMAFGLTIDVTNKELHQNESNPYHNQLI